MVCHAPLYERDRKDSLAQDWAHIPIPRLKGVFGKLAKLGKSIAILLDPLKDPSAVARKALAGDLKSLGVVWRAGEGTVVESDLTVDISHYGAAVGGWWERAPAADEEARPWWGTSTGDLYLNDGVFFRNVPEAVWRYELGGYPVLKKWLGYREAKRRRGKAVEACRGGSFPWHGSSRRGTAGRSGRTGPRVRERGRRLLHG